MNAMTNRVVSSDGNSSIEVVSTDDNNYVLHKYVRRYDPEEEKHYEIRERPDPGGRYDDHALALQEAKRILGLE